MTEVTPYVLMGGRSSRMGRDKAFLPWQGMTLLQQALERLAVFGPARLLSGDAADVQRSVQLAPFGPLVPDRVPGSGPLGGVDAALRETPTPWVLILPIDQPCLPPDALLDWTRQVTATPAKASWFYLPEGPQPLPLLLHRSLAPAVEQALACGKRRLLDTVQEVGHDEILPTFTTHTEWFRNLNFPHDLEVVAE